MADENVFKMLVATDNHVGYLEKDQVRGNDSLETFEEVLKVAREQEVDFILLGGDLFHDNKPSRQVLHRTMELLRHYCMGERVCPIEFRSDQAINFQHSRFPVVNYEDPNYNISIPVFSIHGNHDDPAGVGNLSAMDILSVANLVNYFGKASNIENIEVSPLLMQKGSSKLALYGLGSCRDERLHRMLRRKQVTFLRPEEDTEEWFSVLVLHQNRAKHGVTNHIPESFIPPFFDLVVWGHEHECRIEPEYRVCGEDAEGEETGVYITQPGSSVATSLCEGEMGNKHVGILYIKDTTFRMEPVPLKTVRPFVMDTVLLSKTGIHPRDDKQIVTYLVEKVKTLVNEANSDNSRSKLPLVRLKVEYGGDYETFSAARFGQQFVTEVANPLTILHWYRRRQPTSLRSRSSDSVTDHISTADIPTLDSSNVASLVEEELRAENLSILSEKNLTDALTQFVDKEETEAIADFVKYSLQQTQKYLKDRPISEADIDSQIARERQEVMRRQEEGAKAAHKQMSQTRYTESAEASEGWEEGREDRTEGGGSEEAGRSGRGRGRRGTGSSSRSSRRGKGRGRGRGRGAQGDSTGLRKDVAPPLDFSSGACVTKRKAKQICSTKRIRYESDSCSEEDEVSKKRVKCDDLVDLTQSGSESEEGSLFRGHSGHRKKR